MKLMLIVAVSVGVSAMGFIPPWAALAVMGIASVVTMFSEVGQAKRARNRHVSSWWVGYLAGAIVLSALVALAYTALGYASTQVEQVNYGITAGGLLTMLLVALVVIMMKFPRWVGNLLLVGAALAAIWAWGQL